MWLRILAGRSHIILNQNKEMKRTFFAVAILIGLTACGGSSSGGDEPTPTPSTDVNEVTSVTQVNSNIYVNLTTDKAIYSPGDVVTFTADNLPSGTTKIRYRNNTDVIATASMTSKTWTWTAPSTDGTGYMVDLYQTGTDGSETIVGSIAVDVSSSWKLFPRYGFVSNYGSDKTASQTANEMDWLNRCHINGVQFYDWHYKHHWPLGGTRDNPLDSYTDIANRTIYRSSIQNYITAQHAHGMKAMFYNLCYGALKDASTDGVKTEWYAYKDKSHANMDFLSMAESWKSDIFLMDPSNTEWQAYMAQRNDDVYHNYDFDGYHIDQVGDRGSRYTYDGTSINMPSAFAAFIKAMKAKHSGKSLVMNAVGGYGDQQIAGTGDVDFLYNEVWGNQDQFKDLLTIIKANNTYSSNTLKTVFAAYMNYNKSNGTFNTPGVLLTDAIMFALGGSHLELGGDHNLCSEFFPNSRLTMPTSLRTQLTSYYDFMTGYENLLRGTIGTENNSLAIASSTHKLNAWEPKTGYINYYCKQIGAKQVIHLFNMLNANSTSWRDIDGTMPSPTEQKSIKLTISYTTKINKIWVASPDYIGGVPQELTFKQSKGTVTFTIPSLKYWDMIVIQ